MLISKNGLYVRKGTDDTRVFADLKLYDSIPMQWAVVLDLGAHIGAFAKYALDRGASRVLSVEPDAGNLVVLHRNLREDEKFHVVHAACVKTVTGPVTFYQGGISTMSGTTHPVRGRTPVSVKAVSYDFLLGDNPTVIKCDIEGGEYDLGEELFRCPSAMWVAIEYHYPRKGMREQAIAMHESAAECGYQHLGDPKFESKPFRAAEMVIYKRA